MRWTRRCRVRMRSQGGASRERSREARETSGIVADGEVVWSWHPLLMSSRAEAHSAQPGFDVSFNPRGDGGKRNSSPGRSRRNRKTIAWGMPDVIRCLRCEYSCAYSNYPAHARLRVHWASGIPRALFKCRADDFRQTSDMACRENANVSLRRVGKRTLRANARARTACPPVHARGGHGAKGAP